MEQKLSDTLVKAIDRSSPIMQNLQLASRFNKLVEEGGGSANLEDNKEISIVSNGTVEITPTEGKDGMKKVTANVNVPTSSGSVTLYAWYSETDRTYVHMNIEVSPKDSTDANNTKTLEYDTMDRAIVVKSLHSSAYTRVSDTKFSITRTDGEATFERDSGQDLVLWG